MGLVAKSSHRKYANARTYHCFKGDELVGIFPLDWKMTSEQLEEFLTEIKGLTGADRIVLHWSALEGFVNREVQI